MRDMEDGAAALRRRLQAEPTTVVRTEDDVVSGDEEESDAEFEFPFVGRESAPAADELFAGGRIRAFYPVFGRVLDEEAPAAPPAPASRPALGRLFKLEEARTSSVASTSSSSSSASSSTADAGAGADLDGANPDSYCLWTPGSASAASSPSRGGPPRKSGSTGSIPRWRRIGELVVGRSHSDGKDKFLFLSAPPSPARDRDSKAKQQPPKGTKSAAAAVATELDTVAAGRRLSYSGANSKASTGGGRRTFLPYRQDLVGLFANAHGLRSR